VALRFQVERDEVDRAAKESRATGVTVFMLLVLAVITGAVDWFSGESLASYEKELAFYVGFLFVIWLAAPYYHEFRIRTKEIDGKVSAIEEAVNSSREAQEKLLERLTAIEEELRALKYER
jgi:putative Mn2+ efflux pump MntP